MRTIEQQDQIIQATKQIQDNIRLNINSLLQLDFLLTCQAAELDMISNNLASMHNTIKSNMNKKDPRSKVEEHTANTLKKDAKRISERVGEASAVSSAAVKKLSNELDKTKKFLKNTDQDKYNKLCEISDLYANIYQTFEALVVKSKELLTAQSQEIETFQEYRGKSEKPNKRMSTYMKTHEDNFKTLEGQSKQLQKTFNSLNSNLTKLQKNIDKNKSVKKAQDEGFGLVKELLDLSQENRDALQHRITSGATSLVPSEYDAIKRKSAELNTQATDSSNRVDQPPVTGLSAVKTTSTLPQQPMRYSSEYQAIILPTQDHQSYDIISKVRKPSGLSRAKQQSSNSNNQAPQQYMAVPIEETKLGQSTTTTTTTATSSKHDTYGIGFFKASSSSESGDAANSNLNNPSMEISDKLATENKQERTTVRPRGVTHPSAKKPSRRPPEIRSVSSKPQDDAANDIVNENTSNQTYVSLPVSFFRDARKEYQSLPIDPEQLQQERANKRGTLVLPETPSDTSSEDNANTANDVKKNQGPGNPGGSNI